MLSEKEFKRVTIIAHSGATNSYRTDEELKGGLLVTIKCAFEAFNALTKGHSSTDAVEKAINIMEASGYVNAGAGSVNQFDGIKRMDASIMTSDLECGCVSQLEKFLHPITVARQIMEKKYSFLGIDEGKIPDHIYFSSEKSENIAKNNSNIPFDQNSYQKISLAPLEEEFSYLKLFKDTSQGSDSDNEMDCDTVGSVAFDYFGDITAGTSTGGRGHCLPGRIGDSPIIGAGTYCNRFGGASMTGFGEDIVRHCCAKRAIDIIHFDGANAQLAVDKMVSEFVAETENSLGAISIDKDGNFGVAIAAKSMNWAAVTGLTDGSGLVLDKVLYYGSLKGQIQSAIFK